MSEKYLNLFIEIKNSSFIFFVEEIDDQNNSSIKYKSDVPAIGFEENKISNFEDFFEVIKKNIYLSEQNLKYTFKEITLILDNFDTYFVNLSGYKRLNGSQILRENITYILNTLKFYVDKNEEKKTILHIFNSKFLLDNKKIENPPIGLFGDFYSHELSFHSAPSGESNVAGSFDRPGMLCVFRPLQNMPRKYPASLSAMPDPDTKTTVANNVS